MPRTLKELAAAQWAIIEETGAHLEAARKAGLQVAPIYLNSAKQYGYIVHGHLERSAGPFIQDEHIKCSTRQADALTAVQREAGAFSRVAS